MIKILNILIALILLFILLGGNLIQKRHSTIVTHIANVNDWEAYRFVNYYKPKYYEQYGFIHCSTLSQTEDSLNKYFKDIDTVIILIIDIKKLKSKLKFEQPSSPEDTRINELFPHIYGSINKDAIEKVIKLEKNPDGNFIFDEKY